MSNLSPDEIQALADDGQGRGPTEAAVSQWDRGRVRRLSNDDVAEARRRIGRVLPRVEELFAELANLRIEARLGACHELDAEGLIDDIEDPAALVTFQVGGQPGWCLWDNPIAVATVEDVLGGAPPPTEDEEEEEEEEEAEDAGTSAQTDGDDEVAEENEEGGDEQEPEHSGASRSRPFDPSAYRRFLTPIERRVLVRLLRIAIDEIAAVVGVTVEDYDAVAMVKHAPTWRESRGTRPDPHRLAVELVLATERGDTKLAIHLPMAGARGPLEKTPPNADGGTDVPRHLDSIPVHVHAELGSAELTLADLTSLEPGDVVPIEAAVGDTIALLADGVPFASGALGAHRGHVAVRIDAGRISARKPERANADSKQGDTPNES